MDIGDKEKNYEERKTIQWSSLPSDHFNYRYYGDLPLMTTLTVTAITRIVHLISTHKHLVWNLIHQEVVNGLVDFLAKNYEQIIFLIRTFQTFETIDEKIGTSPKCKLLFLDSLLPLHPAPTWPRFESRRQYLQEKHYYSPILIWSKMWDKKPLC